MSIEIDIATGDSGLARRKAAAVGSLAAGGRESAAVGTHCLRPSRPSGHDRARWGCDLRHVGIYRRTGTWNGRKVTIGGIGGVATREDCRGRGYATLAVNAAIHTLTGRARHRLRDAVLRTAQRCALRKTRLADIQWPGLCGTYSPADVHHSPRWRLMSLESSACYAGSTIDLCGLPW